LILPIEQLHAQELLPQRWKQLVRRDASGRLDPEGAVWGAPYRWGCTLVAYDEQKLSRCVP
jgi:putative spermidine/putrescine transport system substrate-binding protein